VNLVVDTDGDQQTGRQWWGANRQFTWDRLVTVWLTRTEEGAYRGTVGVGDPEGVKLFDFANLVRGKIEFILPSNEHAVVIGVPRAFLGEAEDVTLVGAVGSNTSWNGDLPDSGSTRIILHGGPR
jgi:hypothetical protein